MKIDNPIGKRKYWRRLLNPREFAPCPEGAPRTRRRRVPRRKRERENRHVPGSAAKSYYSPWTKACLGMVAWHTVHSLNVPLYPWRIVNFIASLDSRLLAMACGLSWQPAQ